MNFTDFFLLIWKAIFKQFNFTANHKSSGKMESCYDGFSCGRESRRMPGNTRSSKCRSTGINGGRGKSFSFIS